MIFIYGVPGSGKTFYSKKLGQQLSLPIIEADKHISKKFGTCQAYKLFGQLTKENAIKGLLSVRNQTYQKVFQLIPQTDSVIEGAFLDPNILKDSGKLILIVTLDEKQHLKQFLSHKEKLLDIRKNEFKAARMIQDFLIDEAQKIGGIEIVENNN